jgi:hypothetical protein
LDILTGMRERTFQKREGSRFAAAESRGGVDRWKVTR